MSLGTQNKRGREQIVAEMASRSTELADAIYHAALEAARVYRTANEAAFLEQVRQHCAEHARLFLLCAAKDRSPTEEELEFVRVRGRLRAQENLPVEAIMQTYLAGQRATWAAVRDATTRAHAPQAAEEALTAMTFRYAEAITAALAEGYGAERQRQTGTAGQLQREVVDDLLGGRVDPRDERVAALGLGATEDLRVAVIEVDPVSEVKRAATAVALQLASSPATGLAVDRADTVVAVRQSAAVEPLAAAIRRAAARLESGGVRLRAGIGLVAAGPAGVRTAHQEARRALRHARDTGAVAALDEIDLMDALTEEADGVVSRVAAEKLRGLADDPEIAETLAAYAEADLNAQRAAAALGVHPNTVHYRLDRVRERLGRDPRHFHELAELLLAVRLRAARERGSGR